MISSSFMNNLTGCSWESGYCDGDVPAGFYMTKSSFPSFWILKTNKLNQCNKLANVNNGQEVRNFGLFTGCQESQVEPKPVRFLETNQA